MSNGVSFLGYTYILNDNKLLIKYNSNTIKKVKRKLHKLNRVDKVGYIKGFNSYKGYLYKANTKLKKKFLKELI